jgi:3-methylcrotonyl-CoA carboxylase beta subunit
MNVLESQIQPRAPEFKANAEAMRALVEDLRAKARKVAEGGGPAARG